VLNILILLSLINVNFLFINFYKI